jgi:hypothetical protein
MNLDPMAIANARLLGALPKYLPPEGANGLIRYVLHDMRVANIADGPQ